MNLPDTDRVALVCPDDFSRLERLADGLRCSGCGRHFPARNGVWELLPQESQDLATSEGQRLESYRASYSQRPDRRWLHPVRVLIAELGNAYLYGWASRMMERLAQGRTLRVLDAACGDGMLWRHIARRHDYVGVDFLGAAPGARFPSSPGALYPRRPQSPALCSADF